jgi:hypothetical protein
MFTWWKDLRLVNKQFLPLCFNHYCKNICLSGAMKLHITLKLEAAQLLLTAVLACITYTNNVGASLNISRAYRNLRVTDKPYSQTWMTARPLTLPKVYESV